MHTTILIPYEFLDNYINEHNELKLKGKLYKILKTVGKDTYVEVTYKL